jgi:hypothetical protein
MDSAATHFIQLLVWLTLALGLFGIGRLAIYCLEKTTILDKWFPEPRSFLRENLQPDTPYQPSYYSSPGRQSTPRCYQDRWIREDHDDLGRANSFLGSLFFILSLFYVDDLGERFSQSSSSTFITLGVLVVSSLVFSFGWASERFRRRWDNQAWFRTVFESLYVAGFLFGFIYLAVGAGDDWPLFLIGGAVYLCLLLITYVCFVRRHEHRYGWDFWSMSYMMCLVNLQHDLVANLMYAVFFAHFMATVSRYQPPRLFYSMYSSALPTIS